MNIKLCICMRQHNRYTVCSSHCVNAQKPKSIRIIFYVCECCDYIGERKQIAFGCPAITINVCEISIIKFHAFRGRQHNTRFEKKNKPLFVRSYLISLQVSDGERKKKRERSGTLGLWSNVKYAWAQSGYGMWLWFSVSFVAEPN